MVAGLDQETLRCDQQIADLRPSDRIEHLPSIARTIDHQTATACEQG
jgi:hypothetical protein